MLTYPIEFYDTVETKLHIGIRHELMSPRH
jgi:hypothetical protein